MDKGKIYGVIGPNGVGKTTLIKSLVGIYKNNKGSI
ncbi:MAG: ATP-binding cassette domain-containing protein, partial [Clostridium sp.]|nr:ATP-binding cassette domain-containing protein [Clostridium sp.]